MPADADTSTNLTALNISFLLSLAFVSSIVQCFLLIIDQSGILCQVYVSLQPRIQCAHRSRFSDIACGRAVLGAYLSCCLCVAFGLSDAYRSYAFYEHGVPAYCGVQRRLLTAHPVERSCHRDPAGKVPGRLSCRISQQSSFSCPFITFDDLDVRTYDPDELRRRFGVCFQNDMVFQDTLRENVNFGRSLSQEDIRAALGDAMALEYVDALPEGLDYAAAIKGANLSGGQKQRLLVARALAGKPEVLILDDSSSALDYKTDAAMRRAIHDHYGDTTLIMVAQRVSSIMGMTRILVMDDGKIIGYGTHEELMESCPVYRETYQIQMGDMQ